MKFKYFAILILGIVLSLCLGIQSSYAETSHCGTISSDETWSSSGNVHTVSCNVTVGQGVTLTITDGTIVKFSNGTSLLVNGALRVLGTGIDPIYFTSIKDDLIGGDTNGDGGASLPAPDNWTRIQFNDTSDDATSLIDHAIIRYGGQVGSFSSPNYGAIHLDSASPTIENTQLVENAYCAISANRDSFPTLTTNTLEDNDANGFCVNGGLIANDATWDITDTSYFVRNDSMTIGTGSTLTVAPGVVIKMGDNLSFVVNGALRLQGTGADPIYITSKYDDAVGGDTDGDGGANLPGLSQWTRIQFSNSSDDVNSLIDHAIIRYGGQEASTDYGVIHLDSASPTIQNTQLVDNAYCAISANRESFPTLINNTIEDNDANGFCINGGLIADNTTWNITDTSYFIRNYDMTIGTGSTLTVDPGVIIKMGDNLSFLVNGALRFQGTEVDPIYITSKYDDAVGGDTNGDGGANLPKEDQWTRIQFNDSSDDVNSLIDHTIIRYGGQLPGTDYGVITLVSASPTIQNSTITENAFAGILTNGSTPTLNCNNIFNNNHFGVYNATPITKVNALNQWWGSPSGPYHSSVNTGGAGNQVTDGVEFIPWLAFPCGTSMHSVFLPTIIR